MSFSSYSLSPKQHSKKSNSKKELSLRVKVRRKRNRRYDGEDESEMSGVQTNHRKRRKNDASVSRSTEAENQTNETQSVKGKEDKNSKKFTKPNQIQHSDVRQHQQSSSASLRTCRSSSITRRDGSHDCSTKKKRYKNINCSSQSSMVHARKTQPTKVLESPRTQDKSKEHGCDKNISSSVSVSPSSCPTDNIHAKGKNGLKLKKSKTARERKNYRSTNSTGFTSQKDDIVQSKSSSSRETESDETECEIPGFFYDKEKNRYFKILPGSKGSNVLTREKIANKKAEDKRQKDLKNISNALQCPDYYDYVHLLHKRNLGSLTPQFVEKNIMINTVSQLKLSKSQKLFSTPMGIYENLEHMSHMDLLNPDHSEVLCVWSIKHNAADRIQLVKLTEKHAARESEDFGVKTDHTGVTVIHSWNKVTGVCLAPYRDRPEQRRILYTTVSYTGMSYSLALIRNLTARNGDGDAVITGQSDFNLGKKTTWCCSWNPNDPQFSVGSEKASLLVDVESRRMWEFNTHNSDPLCQTFANQSGRILYSGTRRGEILTHDLRSVSTWPVSCVRQNSSISCIRLLSNEFNMAVSDFTGQVNLWDMRMRKVIFKYNGLVNQYTKIPIHIDENESILYGAGQDCYMNLWDLKFGQQLKCLPPPCPASRETIPCLQFSTHLMNIPGKIGLIVGMEDKIHLYTNSSISAE